MVIKSHKNKLVLLAITLLLTVDISLICVAQENNVSSTQGSHVARGFEVGAQHVRQASDAIQRISAQQQDVQRAIGDIQQKYGQNINMPTNPMNSPEVKSSLQSNPVVVRQGQGVTTGQNQNGQNTQNNNNNQTNANNNDNQSNANNNTNQSTSTSKIAPLIPQKNGENDLPPLGQRRLGERVRRPPKRTQPTAPPRTLSPRVVQRTVMKPVDRNAAFDSVTTQALPLTPNEVMKLRRILDETQQAAAADPKTPPVPTSSSRLVSLAPGSVPPVIRLANGFVASLVFVDVTGAPWPIEAYDLGNPKAFNIQWDKQSNTLMVQALTPYTYGNLAVKLRKLNTPISLTLIPGQRVVDYRADLRIPQRGPNAKVAVQGSGLPDPANQLLLSLLDGVPPDGAHALHILGCSGACQGWLYEKKLYLRAPYTVLSPGWISSMESADGMKVYEMTRTPYVLLSQYGKPVQIKIRGY